MAKETILVIEDERDIVEVLEYNFQREGYTVLSATNGEKGLELARTKRPAVIILDIMLPGLDGLEVAKRLRQDPNTREISIVMLTAKGEESDVILGLGVGADDYVVLRRGPIVEENPTGQRLELQGLIIDKAKYQVMHEGKEVPLTLTEFKLLSTLAMAPGRVFTRELLLEKIQGEAFIDERNIDVHVRSIRKKLGDSTDYVLTVRGVGYKFKE
jgi:DNA-binding response OmpR family regulator